MYTIKLPHEYEFQFGIAPLPRAEERNAESPLPLSRAIDVGRVRNASPTRRSRTDTRQAGGQQDGRAGE